MDARLGQYAESEVHFEQALKLLGLSLKTGRARRELSDAERKDAIEALAALDLSFAHQGKPREPLHRLGVNVGFWARSDQRAPAGRPGLAACPFHRADRYSRLISPIEAAGTAMRDEMMALLRRRAEADESEGGLWYHDHERIAQRPSQWLRRHLSCARPEDARDTPQTCLAVSRAMRWYYAAATPGGTDAEVDPFYLKAQFSVLSPGAHILPHAGPTNEYPTARLEPSTFACPLI